MMINGMVGGLRTLGWACVILTIPVYMLGMLLSQTLGVQERLETLQAAEQDKNVDSFNSVPMAMFTVVRCMTSECTDFKGRPLILEMVNKHGWVLGFLYVLFILLTMLGNSNEAPPTEQRSVDCESQATHPDILGSSTRHVGSSTALW